MALRSGEKFKYVSLTHLPAMELCPNAESAKTFLISARALTNARAHAHTYIHIYIHIHTHSLTHTYIYFLERNVSINVLALCNVRECRIIVYLSSRLSEIIH